MLARPTGWTTVSPLRSEGAAEDFFAEANSWGSASPSFFHAEPQRTTGRILSPGEMSLRKRDFRSVYRRGVGSCQTPVSGVHASYAGAAAPSTSLRTSSRPHGRAEPGNSPKFGELRSPARTRASGPTWFVTARYALFESGSSRIRFPVAAKIALQAAGANGGTPGSPTPAGGASLSTM